MSQPYSIHRYTAALGATLAFLSLSSLPARAAIQLDHEGWFQITGTGPIAGPVRVFLEAQPRIGNNAETNDVDMRALLMRGALGYALTPHWSLWQGYGYTPTFNPDRDEHRNFQQALYETKLGPFNFQNRTRLEERFLEHADHVSVRARNLIRFTFPLPRSPSWALVAMDEFFFDLNTVETAPVSGFDQNRFFTGLSRQLTPNVRLEIDYLNQVLNGRRGKDDTLRHSGLMWLAFTW